MLAQWDITQKCNLRCKHCRREFRSPIDELSLSEGKELLDQLYQLGVELLVISGGEPFLRQDIFELVEYAQKFRGVTITSNGTLINSKIAHKLSRFTNLRISLSLDGIDNTHDYLRGEYGTFEKVINSLEVLVQHGIERSIRCTLSRLNLQDASRLIEVVSQYNISFVEIRSVIPVGRADKNILPDKVAYGQTIERVIARRKELGVKITSGDPILLPIFPQLLGEIWESLGEKVFEDINAGCLAGDEVIYIQANGDIGVCSYIPLVAGNIRSRSLKETILSSTLFNLLKDYKDKLKGKCGICDFKYLCGGCRACALALTGELLGEDSRCLVDSLLDKEGGGQDGS